MVRYTKEMNASNNTANWEESLPERCICMNYACTTLIGPKQIVLFAVF